MPLLSSLLFDDRGGSRAGFKLEAYADLLLLLDIVEALVSIEAEIAAQYTRLSYLRAKAALWDARARGDAAAEAAAQQQVANAFNRMDMEEER